MGTFCQKPNFQWAQDMQSDLTLALMGRQSWVCWRFGRPILHPEMIFSRPCRDWIVLLEPTQHCVLGYAQPSLRD
jgi:hypothetical protein